LRKVRGLLLSNMHDKPELLRATRYVGRQLAPAYTAFLRNAYQQRHQQTPVDIPSGHIWEVPGPLDFVCFVSLSVSIGEIGFAPRGG